MKASLLSQLTTSFAAMSLMAVGGVATVVPEMHHQVVTVQSWMSDTTFANLFAIAQAAPGPNVILASLIGWHLAGPAGLAVATLAICAPSSAVSFAVSRLRRRLLEARWLKTLQTSLMPIPIGLMGASGLIMARAADTTTLTVALTVATTILVGFTRRNPLWALVAGGLAGGAGYFL